MHSIEIRHIDARLPVIIITAFSTTETAIEAMKRGAYEYLLKPVDFDKLYDIVERALEISRMSRVPAMFEVEADGDAAADHIVGRSQAMQEVYKAIGQVAPQDVNVLILGESGTGKEMIARAIYQHSRRSKGRSWPSTALHCRNHCWKASCSATNAAPSPGPTNAASGNSSRLMAARSSWTRSAT